MLFGLIPTVSVYPGQALPTGLLGLTLVLPAALWGRFKLGLPHLLFLVFFAYAIASLGWSYDSKWYGLWMLLPWVVGLCLGTSRDQHKIWMGIAIGLWISSAVAVAQWMGLTWPLTTIGIPAGLYFNQSLHGWLLAIAVVGLVCNRMWTWALPLLPGILLSGSRASLGLVVFGLLATLVRKPIILLTVVLGMASLILDTQYINDIQRIEIWRYALLILTPWGNGVGSFMELWYHDPRQIWQAYFAHNDYIQLVFEYGIGALPLFAAWVWLALRSDHDLWPLYITCLVLALFAFPFYTPITAFIWALACGGIMRNDHGA